jgi:hypothetical protein
VSSWAALAAELSRWRGDGRLPTFWWRDDDATRPSRSLDRLLTIAAGLRAPVALAVIPAAAEAVLAERLDDARVAVLQHGYAHANHAPDGEKKAELGHHRPLAAMPADSPTAPAGWPSCSASAAGRCWCRPGTASIRRWWPCCPASPSPACRPIGRGPAPAPPASPWSTAMSTSSIGGLAAFAAKPQRACAGRRPPRGAAHARADADEATGLGLTHHAVPPSRPPGASSSARSPAVRIGGGAGAAAEELFGQR